MARPSNASEAPFSPWSGWGRGAPTASHVSTPGAVIPYGIYTAHQYHPYVMAPQAVAPQAGPQQQASAMAQQVNPLKRTHSESSDGAGSKDHHILWMRAYDKPIPDSVKSKCKPLFCEMCNVNLNSVIQAKMHYEGKLHEKKVRLALQIWAKENSTIPPKKTNAGQNEGIDEDPSAQRARYESKIQDLYCGPCDTSFTSQAHAMQHFSGRNHTRVMKGLAPLKAGYFNARTGKWQRKPPDEENCEAASNPPPPAEAAFPPAHEPPPPPPGPPPPPPAPPGVVENHVNGPEFYCSMCGVVATSQVQLDMHLSGKHHKQRYAKMTQGSHMHQMPTPNAPLSYMPFRGEQEPVPNVVPKMESDAMLGGNKQKTKKDYSIYRTPSGQFYCALCNLCVNTENLFVQHVASRKHKLKESSAKGKKSKSNK